MLPSGAYVTLEHEYILVLRKGSKTSFYRDDAVRRRQSAFFWEERNSWFSDLWELKGVRQVLASNETRNRSAAFPFELAHRLINMYSIQGDTVLDPFLGTGTTTAACIMNARNSIGFEMLKGFEPIIRQSIDRVGSVTNSQIAQRLSSHVEFVESYIERRDKPLGYINKTYGFPVMTRQEVDLQFLGLESLQEATPLTFSAWHTIADNDVEQKCPVIDVKNTESAEQLVMSFG